MFTAFANFQRKPEPAYTPDRGVHVVAPLSAALCLFSLFSPPILI